MTDQAPVDPAVLALAAAMGGGGRAATPYAAAYGHLKAAVTQYLDDLGDRVHLDQELALLDLVRSLNVVELALFTHRADLQRRRNQASER